MNAALNLLRLSALDRGKGVLMTTTTTGLQPVATALVETVDAAAHSRLIPSRLTSLPWILGCADILAAVVTAVVVGAVLPAWSPDELLPLVVSWPLSVALCGGYTTIGGSPNAVRPKTLLRAAAVSALLAWTAIAVSPGLAPVDTPQAARAVMFVVALAPVLSIALRRTGQLVARPATRRVVLVGESAGLHYLLREARRATDSGRTDLVPVAVCLHGDEPLEPAVVAEAAGSLPVWTRTDELLEVVRVHHAAAVVVAPGPGVSHAELRRWASWLQDEGVELLVSSGLRDVSPSRVGLSAMGGAQLLQVRPAAIAGVRYALKCAADRMAAAVLLVLLAPVLGILALLIRHDSPGPAVFRQTRVGTHGNLFTVYKLRTMRQGADATVDELTDANESDRDGVLFKIRQDPRITRLGALLRRYSLDELPQLVNVVRGEMSLIGPRPALPSEVAEYSPDLRRRLAVKPGLTGLWQVSGRSDLAWEETVRLDLQYVDNWSWTLDGKIALKTVRAVLGHEGAY
jgi:exopolysaccharide biosynthesis polyprenyl glycosylphosphotransferase